MPRPAELAPRDAPPPPGTRVVIDLRPLQEPERTPITAAYLDRLLRAFAERPLPGESFVAVLRALRDDPADELEALGLPMAGRRRVPPTARLLRSGGLTLDSFLLRGAEVGTGVGADASGAAGTLYHTAGGAVPLASRLPVVATLLDLAPWELPDVYARSAAARFGHRLRARILRDATRLIVCSTATAESARRRVHIRAERIVVIPLAADDAFSPAAAERSAEVCQRLGLPARYLVFAGRYDARKDLGTLFAALRSLREERPAADSATDPWPPVVVLAGGDEAESEALARAAARNGVGDLVRRTPYLSPPDLAALEAAARGFVFPAVSEGTGLATVEALAVGTPVIASRTGPLPEIVGNAGIVVEPRDPARLAAALRSFWQDERIHTQLARAAQKRARGPRRTWHDVARETRAVYAAAVKEATRVAPSGW
ncbi:MAG TPA: glycosyltransferase family 1 protein [Candidatus Limnocylindrales bacterium]|nr:glycosyltransferase family 1 protein [Candidatus Limnocylindrales bacterium]